MKALTVKSPLSVPYLFFTRMLYLPESDEFTAVMVKLANLPEANFRMQWSSEVISLSFFSQVTSGKDSSTVLLRPPFPSLNSMAYLPVSFSVGSVICSHSCSPTTPLFMRSEKETAESLSVRETMKTWRHMRKTSDR
ncbi:hypothetical protein EYF80_023967 [Liparis tanakae]|uniref:Uncharacterized protein n=1 Tax=Liparis tanakae TaxID=230148 RepID=A0A4Z2HKJ5_9TELE|nr:hypothetical protein EYF80_023967 [Liparis tanakae]